MTFVHMGVWPRICVLNQCKSSLTFNYPSMNRTGPGTASLTMLNFYILLGHVPSSITWDFKITLTSKSQKSNQIVFGACETRRFPGFPHRPCSQTFGGGWGCEFPAMRGFAFCRQKRRSGFLFRFKNYFRFRLCSSMFLKKSANSSGSLIR